MPGNDTKGTVQQAAGSYVFLVSFVAALGGFLFGYDLNIIGAGMIFLQDQFLLNDVELGFATSSATLGCIFGPALALVLGDKFGRRNCLFLAAGLFAIFAVGTALPQNMSHV